MRSLFIPLFLVAAVSVATEVRRAPADLVAAIQPSITPDPCGECSTGGACPEFACPEFTKRAVQDVCAPCTTGGVCPEWCKSERAIGLGDSSCDCCGECDPTVCGSFCSTCGCVPPKRDLKDQCANCTEDEMCPDYCIEEISKRNVEPEDACAPCSTDGVCPEYCKATITAFTPIATPQHRREIENECGNCSKGGPCPEICIASDSPPMTTAPPLEANVGLNDRDILDECAPCSTKGACPQFCIVSTSIPNMHRFHA